MRRWRWIGAGLAVIVAGLLALPFLIPAERLRGTAEAELAAALPGCAWTGSRPAT